MGTVRSPYLLATIVLFHVSMSGSSLSQTSSDHPDFTRSCVGNGEAPRLLIGPVLDLAAVQSEPDLTENQQSSDRPIKTDADRIARSALDVFSLDDHLSISTVDDLTEGSSSKNVALAKIKDAIINGTDNTGRSLQNRKSLFSALKVLNCEYLVGWTRSLGNAAIVRTLLFDVNTVSVLVPFRSLTFSSRRDPRSVGVELGTRLDAFIRNQIRVHHVPRVTFSVGCVSSTTNDQYSKLEENTRNALRDAVAQIITELSTNLKYNNLATPILCLGAGPERQNWGDFWLGGTIQAAGKEVTFQPILNLLLDEPIKLSLESLSYSGAAESDSNLTLMDEAKSEVLAFSNLRDLGDVTGKVITSFARQSLTMRIASVDSALDGKDLKSGLVLAYVLIGSSPPNASSAERDLASAAGRYELGRGFVEMREFALAIANLARALQNEGAGLPDYLRAAAYEKIGQAYAGTNDTDQAIKSYKKALGYYTDQRRVNDQSRVRGLMSDARLSSGEYDRAAANLDSSPDKNHGAETQYKLGRIQERQGNFGAAIQSYSEALRLDPTSSVTKHYLAHVLGTAGESAIARGDWKSASDNLMKSLNLEELHAISIYLVWLQVN